MSQSDLYVATQGSGRDLVLVHGWGLHGGVWDSIVAQLSRHYRLHIVDLPGHGRSPLPSAPYTLDLLVAELARAVPAGAIWLGWSLGGLISLAAALSGQPIASLVLVGSLPRPLRTSGWPDGIDPEVLKGFAKALSEDYRGTLWRFLLLQCQGSARAQQELQTLRKTLFAHGEPAPEALHGGLRILQQSDLRGGLSTLQLPVMLLSGNRDTLAPLGGVRRTAELIPGAQLCTIKGAAHAPFISHPETFTEHLGHFLNGEGSR